MSRRKRDDLLIPRSKERIAFNEHRANASLRSRSKGNFEVSNRTRAHDRDLLRYRLCRRFNI
jgi:hypothetical protein